LIYAFTLELLQYVSMIIGLVEGFQSSNWVQVFTNTWQTYEQDIIWNILA
jgi:hypothetical protein